MGGKRGEGLKEKAVQHCICVCVRFSSQQFFEKKEHFLKVK